MNTDNLFMMRALELAQFAADDGEVPVGAVIVHDGEIVGEGYNQPISSCDPTAPVSYTHLTLPTTPYV